ncbi:MAG: protein translocase subunit SecD [Spirochaetes bacterium]|uniref:Protein translocase subunit SecD n=1 Tax=Candidatus Avitreponema avistercoris TaxID=2840705 RepID=A0A9D9EN00_9SPIR|nr:protein translocase subunit SecD [Candidatus Avitreponema avistercoris]
MNKRSRFALILVVLAICFAFLWPTAKWYFLTPREDQTLALGSRERIKDYARNMAAGDVQELLTLARSGSGSTEPLPERFDGLVQAARHNYKQMGKEIPSVWTAAAVLSAFGSESDAVDTAEGLYRDGILSLKRTQERAVKLGLDLSGGMSFIIKADLAAAEAAAGENVTNSVQFRDEAMMQAMEIISDRIDRFGLSEPVVRRQGEDRIYIEIPGTADSDRINSIISGRGMLAFHLVDAEATAAFQSYYAAHPATTFDADYNLLDPSVIPEDCQVMGVYTKDVYGIDERIGFRVIKRTVALEGRHIQSAQVSRDEMGRPTVVFRLDPEGTEIFRIVTTENQGQSLAIVSDEKIKSVANIREPIPGGSVQISGFSAEEAENLQTVLRTAWLNVPLELESQQVVGASMGELAIRQGLNALLGGLGAVVVFLLFFYRGAGVNAFVAQFLNLFIMFSVLSAFNLTLTLPSIAGMILTIGMAVDANVVIFERIKEELRAGKTRRAAVAAGFDHAFWAIMDSNITTFIAAIFLSQLGTGPIKGFAVSLAIGVVSSVFTALFVSRLMFDFGTDVMKREKVSISWRISK